MNRRSFLSFLSVAPVALPMAAKAMANTPVSPFASGGICKSPKLAIIGEYTTEAFIPLRSGPLPVITRNRLYGKPVPLFVRCELDSSVIGESVPQTERSPES